jgi:ankyrin repeat protein
MKLTSLTALTFIILATLAGAGLAAAQDSSPANDLDRQLLKSADHDDIASVRQLLDRGANAEARGHNGFTALAMAAEHGDVAMVKLLLEKGAEVGAKDETDETTLVLAARGGNVEIMELLLRRTSDVQDKNRALFEAAGGGPVVIQMEDSNSKPNEPHGPVPAAAWDAPWVKTVKLLLDSGAYIEARDSERSTPLIRAASLGQTDIFMLLLERGADIQARDKYGNTALIAAACECAVATMNSTYDIVKLLLQKGADPNARTHEGTTALMNAASGFGDASIVKLLLESGADPSSKDNHGNTAMALAIRSERPDKVQVLKEAVAHGH